MSRGLGKVERHILEVCKELLSMKETMLAEGMKDHDSPEFGKGKVPNVLHYPGGTRIIDQNGYSRRCSVLGGQYYVSPSEDILDLREVSYFYRMQLSGGEVMPQWISKRIRTHMFFVEPSEESSYYRAVRSLVRKGYLTKTSVNGRYLTNQLRFVKCQVSKTNT